MKNIKKYYPNIKNKKVLEKDITKLEEEKKIALEKVAELNKKKRKFNNEIRKEIKNIMNNTLISTSTKKSSETRRKENFGELDNIQIKEEMKTKHRREHLRGLGESFKEIYFDDETHEVNNIPKMKKY